MSPPTPQTNTDLLYDLKHTVYGNGDKGLKMKVNDLEHEMSDVQEFIRTWKRLQWLILSTMVTGALSAVASLALLVLRFAIEHGRSATWLLPLMLVVLTGCAPVTRSLNATIPTPDGTAIVSVAESGPVLIGEWSPELAYARTADGDTSLTVRDARTKNTVNNLWSGLAGAFAGWLARGGL
jgi:hypothetical protein